MNRIPHSWTSCRVSGIWKKKDGINKAYKPSAVKRELRKSQTESMQKLRISGYGRSKSTIDFRKTDICTSRNREGQYCLCSTAFNKRSLIRTRSIFTLAVSRDLKNQPTNIKNSLSRKNPPIRIDSKKSAKRWWVQKIRPNYEYPWKSAKNAHNFSTNSTKRV